MARGWESKSIESQMEDAVRQPARPLPTPISPEQARIAERLEILRLNHSRVQRELAASSNPRFREQLSKEIIFLEQQIRKLEEPPCKGSSSSATRSAKG